MWNLISQTVPFSIRPILGPSDGVGRKLHVSYVDMVSLMLTGVTIMLAILGFVVAVLAFVGWRSIQTIAEASARSTVSDAIKDGGRLHSVVQKEVRDIIRYSGVEALDTEFEEQVGNDGANNEP